MAGRAFYLELPAALIKDQNEWTDQFMVKYCLSACLLERFSFHCFRSAMKNYCELSVEEYVNKYC